MGGALLTRGHAAARAGVEAMISGRPPHALLLAGPPGVGKTTLALDLAAGLLCTAPDPADRPCRACRACRLVASGGHADLHRIAPAGAGDQIRIGDRSRPDDGTIRRLVADLALLPVEGGHRVAIVERADRMNDDAQSALLKTLEEPPAGVTIILCADDEERLLPTVRSRCARLRLGPVAIRDIEELLAERGAADAPTAARLARIAAGRPGLAHALALSPEAVAARQALSRILVDLVAGAATARLTAATELLSRATEIDRAVASPVEGGVGGRGGKAGRGRRQGGGASVAPPAARPAASSGDDEGDDPDDEAGDGTMGRGGASASAAERRRAVATIIGVWRDLARDLALVRLGEERRLRDPGLLDDLRAAPPVEAPALAGFLARLDAVGEALEANVRPELALDALLLAWPRRAA